MWATKKPARTETQLTSSWLWRCTSCRLARSPSSSLRSLAPTPCRAPRASASRCSGLRPASGCRPRSRRCACPWSGTCRCRRPTVAASSSWPPRSPCPAFGQLNVSTSVSVVSGLAPLPWPIRKMPPKKSAVCPPAAISVTRPLSVSTIVPTGSCSPSVSVRKRLRPGSLTLTVPSGSTLTVLPASGSGSSSSGGGCVVPPPGCGGPGGAMLPS